MKFSANLGFLWTDLSLPDAIHAAKAAGFDAVECHWPYAIPAVQVRAALDQTGLPMLGLNTIKGAAGEFGLSALPGREAEARAAIDQALDYARTIGAGQVHVMAGLAQGPRAEATYLDNLRHACARALPLGLGILIEPLNPHDAPGYFLSSMAQAAGIIAQLALPNLKLMFDCYHVQRGEGDLTTRLTDLLPMIGHIQFAGVPDRGPPDRGEVAFAHVFRHIDALGWTLPLGAEYRPGGPTGATLDWMQTLRD